MTAIRLQLCQMLALFAGQPITQAVALEIVGVLFPDRTYFAAQFGKREFNGYTFQAEYLGNVLAELHPMHEQHYFETEKYRAGIPINPDYDGMKERERNGALIQFTARTQAGQIVGHMRVVIGTSTHTQTLYCDEDTFYVVPEHRGGFMAVRLWQFVESAVRSIGVREVRFSSKLANKADRMARYLKYEPVALQFVKTFDD